MPTVKIVCPGCKGNFTCKVADINILASQTFNCPKCGIRIPFRQMMAPQKQSYQPLKTHIASGMAPQSQQKTRIAATGSGITLVVDVSGKRIPVPAGNHILGRESSDSNANIKIAPDPYMSRMQARLSVEITPQGPLTRIMSLNPSNPVFVNDRNIASNQVTLRNGDSILLGMTRVTVRL